MTDYAKKFHWADYLLFALSFAVTIGVGIFFAIRDKWHKQSAESYLMADRKMNFFLVGMSFLASAMSALLFVGITADFYYFGINLAWVGIAYYIGAAFTAVFVIPKFYRMGFKITSAYEYFQHRFNLPVRMVVGSTYFLTQLLYMAVSLYVPSLVLSQVSVLNIYWSTALGAVVCLIYTGFGGMKAVIWVDNIQIIIVAAGMTLLAVKGTLDAGGMSKVWEVYSGIGERNNWNDIKADPWDRHNVWNVIFMWGFTLISGFATPQSLLQRYMTVPSMRKAQWSIIVGITIGIPFLLLVCIIGIAAFAVLGGNEPLLTGQMDKADQIMPFFLMHLLGDLHGIPGLVVASLFAAALSTLSSGENALVAVLLEDVIRPIHRLRTNRELSNKASGILSRTLGIVVGIVVMGIAVGVPKLDDGIVALAVSVNGFVGGPLLGLLMVALFFFWVESWGALVGFIASVGWAVMMYFGSKAYGTKIGYESPPLFKNNFTERVDIIPPDVEPGLFDVSYTWYVFLDMLVVMVVSTVISLFIHCGRHGCRPRLKDIMPPKELRYTTEDFLIALGCKKDPKDEKANEMTDRNGMDSKFDDIGEDNKAFENGEMGIRHSTPNHVRHVINSERL